MGDGVAAIDRLRVAGVMAGLEEVARAAPIRAMALRIYASACWTATFAYD